MDEGRQVTVLWQEDESLAFVANGRAYRSEFHVNPSAETMLQLRGEMRLHYLTPEGEEKVRVLKEGEYMYCPPGLPHSPRFPRGRYVQISHAPAAPGRAGPLPLVLRAVPRPGLRGGLRGARLRRESGQPGVPGVLRLARAPDLQGLWPRDARPRRPVVPGGQSGSTRSLNPPPGAPGSPSTRCAGGAAPPCYDRIPTVALSASESTCRSTRRSMAGTWPT